MSTHTQTDTHTPINLPLLRATHARGNYDLIFVDITHLHGGLPSLGFVKKIVCMHAHGYTYVYTLQLNNSTPRGESRILDRGAKNILLKKKRKKRSSIFQTMCFLHDSSIIVHAQWVHVAMIM